MLLLKPGSLTEEKVHAAQQYQNIVLASHLRATLATRICQPAQFDSVMISPAIEDRLASQPCCLLPLGKLRPIAVPSIY